MVHPQLLAFNLVEPRPKKSSIKAWDESWPQYMGIYKYIIRGLLDKVYKHHWKYMRGPSSMDELRRIGAIHSRYKHHIPEAKLASQILDRLAKDPEVANLPSRLLYEESKVKIVNTSNKIDDMIDMCKTRSNAMVADMYSNSGSPYTPPKRELFDQLIQEDMARYEEMRQVTLACGLSDSTIDEETIHTSKYLAWKKEIS